MASDHDYEDLVNKAQQLEEEEEDGRDYQVSGQQRKHAVAKAWQAAAEAAQTQLGKYNGTTMTIRDRWAVSLREAGDYEKAIACNRENVERYVKRRGAGHELTLDARRRLAENYMKIRSYDEAIKHYGAVVDATGDSGLDAKTVEVHCQDRSDYAAALFESRETKYLHLAVDVNQQSLRLAKQYLGDDHYETVKIQYDLGVEFLKLSKHDDAAAELEKCFKVLIHPKCKIRDHPEYNQLLFDVHTTLKKSKPQLALDDTKRKNTRKELKMPKVEPETKDKKIQGRLDALDLAGPKSQTRKKADVNDKRAESVYLNWEKEKLKQSARIRQPETPPSQGDKGNIDKANLDKRPVELTKEALEQLRSSGSSSRHARQTSTPTIEVSPAASRTQHKSKEQRPNEGVQSSVISSKNAFSPTSENSNDPRSRVPQGESSSTQASQTSTGKETKAGTESKKRNRHSEGTLHTKSDVSTILEKLQLEMPNLIGSTPQVNKLVQRRHSHSGPRSKNPSMKKPNETNLKQPHEAKPMANIQSIPGSFADATLSEPHDQMIRKEVPVGGTARQLIPGGWQLDFDEPISKLEMRRVSSNTVLQAPQSASSNSDVKRTRSSSHEPPRVRSAPPNSRANKAVFSDEAVSKADEWFEELEREVHEGFLDAYRDDNLMKRAARTVKIAILDTGISKKGSPSQIPDAIRRASRRIKFGKLVDPDLPPHEDTNGHGTHAAGLILRVCPYADLYVYRVSKDGNNISRKNVTEALNDAVEKNKVDIVSMSLGWNEDNDEDLRAAIDRAKTNKVLMFAASSNEGARRRMAYPARADEVIAVDAADGFGSPSKFNPPPSHKERFTALGEAVNSSFPLALYDNDEEPRGWKRMSGTSCATPIAAAIAGLILEFSRQRPLCYDPLVESHLKRVDGMREVFREILSTRTSSFNYLDPMQLFRFNESYLDGGRWLDFNSTRCFAAMRIGRCLQPFGGSIGKSMGEAINRALANGEQG